MFGYVIANVDALSPEDKTTYRALYCGLCQALGEQYGLRGRMMLTYDMTFLVLLLSALDDAPVIGGEFVCPVHPLKKQQCHATPQTAYAADISAVLAYYQALDDKQDDRRISGTLRASAIEKAARTAAARHPAVSQAIKDAIAQLNDMETTGETNPDAPANAFGQALGEVFAVGNEPQQEALRAFGWALGRFIYLMDAVMDLKDDLLKERYNALIAVPTEHHLPLLQTQMALCTTLYEQLPVLRYKTILDNILYSGIWTRFESKYKGKSAI